MASASVNDFRMMFPSFEAETDAKVQSAIDSAAYLHDSTERGLLLAAAHILTLHKLRTSEVDGGQGVVKRERIGQQEVEYETNSGGNPTDVWWATTAYGREFLQVEARNPRQVFSVICG